MEKLYLWEQGQTPLFNPDIQDQDEPSLSAYPVPWAAEEARGERKKRLRDERGDP